MANPILPALGVAERERIWRVQVHPSRTPLAPDVDFRALAETYEASGGDIHNAVLKAAIAAASEPGQDTAKMIHQRHLDEAIRDVIASRRVMRQSLAPSADARPAGQAGSAAMLLALAALVVALVALVLAIVR
jgi:ATP-dependent Zn protease